MSHGSGEEENYWPGYVDALTSMVQVLAFVMMLLALAVYVLSQNVSRSAVVAISKAVEIKPDANATVEQLLGDVLAEVARLKALAANATARGETRPEEKGPGLESAATAASKSAGGLDVAKTETKAGDSNSGLADAQADRNGAATAKVGDAAGAKEKAGPKDGASAAAEADKSGAAATKSETIGIEAHNADGVGANSAISRPLLTRHQEPGPASGKAIVLHFPARSFQLEPAMTAALANFLTDNHADAAGSLEVRAYAGAESGALTEARRLADYRAMTLRKARADRKILLAHIHVFLIDTPEKSLDSAAEISLGRASEN